MRLFLCLQPTGFNINYICIFKINSTTGNGGIQYLWKICFPWRAQISIINNNIYCQILWIKFIRIKYHPHLPNQNQINILNMNILDSQLIAWTIVLWTNNLLLVKITEISSTRVVHCQFHLLDHCFHMLNPLISNYQSILHWFQLHYHDVLLTFFPVTV